MSLNRCWSAALAAAFAAAVPLFAEHSDCYGRTGCDVRVPPPYLPRRRGTNPERP